MPFEQLLVAFATYCTVVATLLLLVGAETQTPAWAKLVKHTNAQKYRRINCINLLQLLLRSDAGLLKTHATRE
jgi:hypothetical protein